MKRLTTIIICLAAALSTAGQSFYVMEYNVENLFDCRHDSLKNDYEYLPGKMRAWNYRRYRTKLDRIAKVIASAVPGELPDIVGLCEVENQRCMRDLTRYSALREAGYKYIITESPDLRGIDVALLYQRGTFKPIDKEAIRITPLEGHRPTRDILHVSGLIITGDTLDIFLCHMPSRSGGQALSEPYRLHTARTLRHKTDSVSKARNHPEIIIIGDFNDYPRDKALKKELQTHKPTETPSCGKLYNLMERRGEWTYSHKGRKGVLDHAIVSGELLIPKEYHITATGARSVRQAWLLEEDPVYGGVKPRRSYNGMRYNDGWSDHLPILITLKYKIH